MAEERSRFKDCFDSCLTDGDGNVAKGITKKLAALIWDTEHFDSETVTKDRLLHDITDGYVAVNAVGPYIDVNPILLNISMAKRYNNGNVDWPVDQFVRYCESIIATDKIDTMKFIAMQLTTLSQINAEYTNCGSVDDEKKYVALGDAYVAMMVARRLFDIDEDELEAEEANIFAKITHRLEVSGENA